MREDGTEISCELVHLEPEDGIDMWGIAGASIRVKRDRVQCAPLPPKTGLRIVGSLPMEEP